MWAETLRESPVKRLLEPEQLGWQGHHRHSGRSGSETIRTTSRRSNGRICRSGGALQVLAPRPPAPRPASAPETGRAAPASDPAPSVVMQPKGKPAPAKARAPAAPAPTTPSRPADPIRARAG